MDNSYELTLAFAIVSNSLDAYMKNRNKNSKPILVSVTRMGYLFIQWLYENREQFEKRKVLEEIDIYSSKYVDLIFDEKDIFASRDLILWDVVYDKVDVLFQYYVLFRKWGIGDQITPMSYRYLFSSLNEESFYRQTQYKDFKEIYSSMFGNLDTIDEKTHEQYRKDFYEEVNKHPRHCISISDAGSLCIHLQNNIEKWFYPTLFEYPLLKSTESQNKFIQISKEVWEQLTREEITWKFVQNRDNDEKNIACSASFFFPPSAIQNHLPMELISLCGVKVKYEEHVDTVTLLLTPFLSLKSMTYRNIVHCFHELYKDIDNKDEKMFAVFLDEEKVEQALFKKGLLEGSTFFKALYQRLEYYFSYYVGVQFQEYLKTYGVSVQYDWTWMKQNMPQKILQDSKALQNLSIEQMEERMHSIHIEPCYLDEVEKTEERIKEKEMLSYMRYLFATFFYDNKSVMLEQLEQRLLASDCYHQERFMENVLLLLEENRLDSCLKDNREEYRIEKELLACQNSQLLRDIASFMFPYIYTFYEERTLEEYERFIFRLHSYFYRKRYFDIYSDILFRLYASYFGEGDVKKKIEYNFFQVRDYLEGENREQQKVFELVQDWKL